MINKPRMVKMPSPNFFTPNEMTVSQVAAVVLHGSAGPAGPSIDWLRNPRRDNPGAAVSSNYFISKSGVTYELVPWEPGYRSFANGIIELPDLSLAWLRNAIKRRINPNWITVSIEHEATDSEMRNRAAMTDNQFNSSIDLTAYVLRQAGLKASHETINGHFQISGKDKANCPGVINIGAYTEVLILRNPDLKP